MPVRIRLRRVGRKKQPSYRIVVADSRSPRSGGYIENVGFYNPRRDPIELRVDLEKVEQWVSRGAELTPTVASLVRKARRGEGVPPGGAQAPAGRADAAPAAPAPEAVAEVPTEAAAAGEETTAAADEATE